MKGYKWNKTYPYTIPGPFFITHAECVAIVKIMARNKHV